MKKNIFIAFFIFGGIFAMVFFVQSTGFGLAKVDEEKTLSWEGFDEIQVNMTSENIHVYKMDTEGDIRFHYYGRSFPARGLVIESENGKIFIKPDAKYWLGNLKLDIYLPANYEQAISIKSSSGDVALDAIELTQLNIETTSGNLFMDTLKASSVSIQTTSGTLDVNNIETGSLQVSTQSGKLIIGDCSVIDFLFKSSSADILLSSITGNVDIKTTSGKVKLNFPEFDNNKLKVATTSGEIFIDLPLDAGFSLDAHTTSGTIQSDFALQKNEKHQASGQVGVGEGHIFISTTSGNIGITKNK